jgi:hypothetical protein
MRFFYLVRSSYFIAASTAVFVFSCSACAAAQSVNGDYARDPHQAVDQEYTKKIHDDTTNPEFLSPLIDYLPASETVPTPEKVLGDIAGAPNMLPYAEDVYKYRYVDPCR